MRYLPSALVVFLALAACSKHECELDTDGKKAAFGALADMTAGAYSCDVEGAALIDGLVMPDLRCEIGASNCAATMSAIHPSPATVKDVAARYRGFLEKAQWTIEEKATSGQFMNGKPYEGVELRAKSGEKLLLVQVMPFGQDMVETRSMLDAGK
jgi:hypothetical protein